MSIEVTICLTSFAVESLGLLERRWWCVETSSDGRETVMPFRGLNELGS